MSTRRSGIIRRAALGRLQHAAHGGPNGSDQNCAPIVADFSTSVNAYGPAPSVLAAVRDALAPSCVAAYPDPTCSEPRAALARHLQVSTSEIAVGAGATELILAVVMAFVEPGDRVLVPPHAFAEYARAATLVGARPVSVLHGETASHEVSIDRLVTAYADALSAQAPRAAFLCSPESPRGRAWPLDALRAVAEACASAGTLLVLDQSFDPFTASPVGTPALRDHAGTLHLRSLTKDHALAGLRLGYVVGQADIVSAVEEARMPWMVSAPAQAAAVASCASVAIAHVRDTTARLRASAADLVAVAKRLGIATLSSDTHYLLLDVGDGATFAAELRERHGIKVRDCASFGLPGHVRVAARTEEENALLVAALDAAALAWRRAPLAGRAE